MWCIRRQITILARSSHHSRLASSYLHNPGVEPLQYRTVGEVLQQSADLWPDRPAVRSVHQNITLTYSQLLTQADALGCGLRAAGLERGDRLGVWSHNCAEWIVTLVAAARTGIIPVALNPAYEESELTFCIQQVGMKGILVADKLNNRDYFALLQRVVPELRSARPGDLHSKAFPELKTVVSLSEERQPGALRYRNLIEDNESADLSKCSLEIQPEDGCIIHLTSGTTGQPKAALDSHFGIVNNTYFLGKRTTLHFGHEKICVQVPIFHAFGTVITVLAALRHGSTLVLPSAVYSPRANIHALMTEGCTVIHGTPTMYVDAVTLMRQGAAGAAAAAAPRLRVALTAGAPCSPQLIRDIQAHLNVDCVKSLFGMTETTAAIFQSIDGETMDKVTETVGYLHDHVEVKVVDENLKAVEFGQAGELLVRGYNVMMGYWGEPERTRQVIGADGWLRTGDQFTIGEDGYGRIVGRIKDLIIRGGENIHPKEIEDVLNTHPEIIESQVFGVADERLGEEVCAAVRTRGGDVTLPELRAHCAGKLAAYKLPRLLKCVDAFPKTASGKVQKYRLKEMVEKGTI